MIDDREDAEQAALHARLEKLGAALRRVEDEKAARETPPPVRKGFSHAMRVGLNAMSEFVGAVILGGLMGWQADKWLGTGPWLLVLLLGLGVAAGFYNVYRVARPRNGSSGVEDLDQDA